MTTLPLPCAGVGWPSGSWPHASWLRIRALRASRARRFEIAARRRRTERDVARRTLGQNFLADARTATRVVKTVDPTPGETVLEVGAGRGDLTGRLLEAGCAVIAVERDAHWSRALRQRFGADQRLAVVEGDVLEIPLPEEPYRAFGNVPFNLTTAILRRLLAPDNASMYRADLIVQWEVARKHASPVPRAVNSLIWQATFRFSILLRIPAASFRPIPSVDGALLAAVRRDVPLVDAAELPLFAGLVRTAFTGSGLLHANLRDFLAPKQMQHLRRELGIGPLTRASDLDAQQWAKLFHTSRASVPEERWSRLATDVHISAPPSRHRRRASDR